MRVSEHMMTNSILRGINDSKTRMNKLQRQISSGKRLHQSSDDPFAFAKSAKYKTLIEKNDQYLRSINLSMGIVEASQSGIENLNNLIQDAKEKATQGADDALAAEDREALAQEIQGIMDEVLTQLNGQFDGKHLFAGTLFTQRRDGFIDEILHRPSTLTATQFDEVVEDLHPRFRVGDFGMELHTVNLTLLVGHCRHRTAMGYAQPRKPYRHLDDGVAVAHPNPLNTL